jgi:ligand-binding sensor domain-containing protein/signal transduction histidine kinase
MRKITLLLLTAVLTALAAHAEVIPDMKFRRLDTRDGLSHSQVNCIFRDSHGFVWFGTAYGLNRYDGYRIKTYYSNTRDTTTMRDNYTDQIQEAWDGKLWLKQNMNYSIYDPKTELFERSATRELSRFGIIGGLERVYIDQQKNFWVKIHEKGFFYYNPRNRMMTNVKVGYGKGLFNPTYGVSAMADFNGRLLVVTYCGELLCLDGQKGVVEWEDRWVREHGGPENQDYRLFVDKEGIIYVINNENTCVYATKEKRWYASLAEFLHSRGIDDIPPTVQVWAVGRDRHNWLWVATDHYGLFVVNMETRQVRQFQNNKLDESTLSDNTPRQIYLDPTGHMWIGTYKNGVNQYVEGTSSLRSVELGDINAVVEDRWGNYWLGTNDKGIVVWNPKTGEELAHYTTANTNMLGNIMVGRCVASDGSIWFGGYNSGLTRCQPQSPDGKAIVTSWRATGQPGDLAINNVWSVTEDKWHRIWIGTLGGGIQMLDLKTGKFRTWNTKNTNLPSDYFSSAGWISKGWLLMGTSWYYCFLNPVTGKVANRVIPEDPSVTVNVQHTVCVMEDSRGLIWQGSTSGVVFYDPVRGQVTLLDMKDGLFGSSACSIVEDHLHNIWVVTDHGVSRVIPQLQDDGKWQFIIRSYNNRDGLQQATYNQRSAFVTRDGLVLVGGQGGLDIINPNTLSDSKSKERPVFSGLQIFDRDVPVGREFDGHVILDEALDVSRELTLSVNDQFTIQLASNAGNVNNGRRFVYRLEGFNDNWVKTSEQNPNITYNSLRAGDYTLYVRMLNEDGTIGEEEASLDITIRPALWRTRWAMLLYILMLAGIALQWRRWYMRRQERRMEVETRRRELEKTQWMNEMRLQMEQEMVVREQAVRDAVYGQASTVSEQPASAAKAAEPVELHPFVTDVVDFMRQLCSSYVPEKPDATCKISFISPSKELHASIDGRLLTEAFHILFRNSVNFCPVDCAISVGVVRTKDDKIHIQVADNGIGIKDEYKTHAFDPMGEGEGIGLDRVKAIVEAHGGDIHIEDNPGGGTIFVINIPLHDIIEEAIIIEDE